MQMVGPDGKPVKVLPTHLVVTDEHGVPVIGPDSKLIFVPKGSTMCIPFTDGKCFGLNPLGLRSLTERIIQT